MRRVPARLLACTMMVGGLAVVAAPAAYAKDKKAEQAAVPELSPAFRAAAGPVQLAIQAKNYTAASAGLAAAEAAATTPYEKYVIAKFRLEVAANLNDAASQNKAVEAILASGQADPRELPSMYFAAGNYAYTQGEYEQAASRLASAIKLGYAQNNAPLMLADTYLKLNRLDDSFAVTRQTIAAKRAAGEQVPVDWFTRPASAAQKAGRSADMIDFLTQRTEAYPTPENWRNTGLIYLQSTKPAKDVELDTWRLLGLTGALRTRQEYYAWAALAADAALHGESVRAYQAGIRSGNVETSDAEFLALSKKQAASMTKDKATLAGLESESAKSDTGVTARSTGDAWLSYDDNAKAAEMYRLALQKGGVDAAQVNTRLGIALAKSGDHAGAKQAFAAVTGPRAGLAKLWTVYIDRKMAGPAVSDTPTG